jgi:cell wall-associated NlpC family hydrolase
MRADRRFRASFRAPLIGVALLLVATVIPVNASAASSSRKDLSKAKDHLSALDRGLAGLVEQYDQTQVFLSDAQARLARFQQLASQAQADANAAREALTERVVAAYEQNGTVVASVLSSESLGDLADRVMFVQKLAAQDAELASNADRTRGIALTTASNVARTVRIRQALLDRMAARQAEIEQSIEVQQALVAQIAGSVAKAEAAARAEAARQKALRTAAPKLPAGSSTPAPTTPAKPTPTPTPTATSTAPAPSPNPTSGSGGSSGPSAAALIAVRAAYSVLGVRYQWAGASPSTGFDCSGLTMWSWAHAGVSLPHSSALQYQVIRHVSRSQLLPGDLVFFYSPISHVGIYVGNDMMIHAPHTGSSVQVTRLSTYPSFVGAGRPG